MIPALTRFTRDPCYFTGSEPFSTARYINIKRPNKIVRQFRRIETPGVQQIDRVFDLHAAEMSIPAQNVPRLSQRKADLDSRDSLYALCLRAREQNSTMYHKAAVTDHYYNKRVHGEHTGGGTFNPIKYLSIERPTVSSLIY